MKLNDHQTPFIVLHRHNAERLHAALMIGWSIKASFIAMSPPDCLRRFASADDVAYRILVTTIGPGVQKSQLPALWKSIECALVAIDAPFTQDN